MNSTMQRFKLSIGNFIFFCVALPIWLFHFESLSSIFSNPNDFKRIFRFFLCFFIVSGSISTNNCFIIQYSKFFVQNFFSFPFCLYFFVFPLFPSKLSLENVRFYFFFLNKKPLGFAQAVIFSSYILDLDVKRIEHWILISLCGIISMIECELFMFTC